MDMTQKDQDLLHSEFTTSRGFVQTLEQLQTDEEYKPCAFASSHTSSLHTCTASGTLCVLHASSFSVVLDGAVQWQALPSGFFDICTS